MARKPKKGYFVRGQFVAEGSELDEQYRRALKGGDAPSKTELKAQSAQLQALGEALLTLRPALREALALPARLEEALAELARITDFEGRRRQSQYVGKLMRQLDEDGIAAIHAALEQQLRATENNIREFLNARIDVISTTPPQPVSGSVYSVRPN